MTPKLIINIDMDFVNIFKIIFNYEGEKDLTPGSGCTFKIEVYNLKTLIKCRQTDSTAAGKRNTLKNHFS